MEVSDATLSLPPHDLVEGATRITNTLAPDVIIYADLPLDPLTYALALLRLAPVQMALWGHIPSPGEHHTVLLVRLVVLGGGRGGRRRVLGV